MAVFYSDGNGVSRKDGFLLDIDAGFVILRLTDLTLKGKKENSDIMLPIEKIVRMEAKGG